LWCYSYYFILSDDISFQNNTLIYQGEGTTEYEEKNHFNGFIF